MALRGKPIEVPDFWRCLTCGTRNPPAPYITRCLGCGEARPARVQAVQAPAEPVRRWSPRPLNRRAKWVLGITLAYFAMTVLVFAVMRLFAESWLPATLILFAPRAVLLLPLPILIGLALWTRRPILLIADGLLLAFILGPFMRLSLPIGSMFHGSSPGTTIHMMTLNQGTGPLDRAALRLLIRKHSVNVICFQEGRGRTALEGADAQGWNFDSSGLIASRFPIVEELKPEDPNSFQERWFWALIIKRVKIELPDGRRCMIVCVHMGTMRTALNFLKNGETATAYRYQDWRWKQMNDLIGRLGDSGDLPVLIGGDFNMPDDSPMMAPLHRQFRDSFREAGWGFGYTRPTAWPFVRIDQILVSPEWDVRHSWVGPDVGSDHLPYLSTVVLPASPAAPK
jgi:hypothetical protein